MCDRSRNGYGVANMRSEIDGVAPQFPSAAILAHQFVLMSKWVPMPKGEVYVATEAPKGELGFYIVSDGGGRPYRIKIRAPSYVHVSALSNMVTGHMVADVIACIGTIDIVLGECDR